MLETVRSSRTASETRPSRSIASLTSVIDCANTRPEPAITQVSAHLIEVSAAGTVLGFVEIADGVFVALAGERYDRAVEVGQALDLNRAVSVLAA
jgi:hypothetical protein